MLINEEEKKKREDEAKAIINFNSIGDTINSINYANSNNLKIETQNEDEQTFINKVNEANDIINAINPRQNIAVPSINEEDKFESEQNANMFIDLMDKDNGINNKRSLQDGYVILSDEDKGLVVPENIGNERNTEMSIAKNVSNKLTLEEKKQNFEGYINAKKSSMQTVSNVIQDNARVRKDAEQKTKTLIEQANTEFRRQHPATVNMEQNVNNTRINPEIKLANSSETKNLKVPKSGDFFKLTDGKIDDRLQAQKIVDSAFGIGGNVLMGMESVIPSTVNYINEGGKLATSKAGSYLAKSLLNADEKSSQLIGELVFNKLWDVTEISKINKEVNSDELKKWRADTIATNNKNTYYGSKIAEIAPSVGQNIIPMVVSYFNPPAGTALFMTSAAGGYLEDAEQRGMNKDQAFTYATVMGIFEGATEEVISGKMISNSMKLFGGVGLSEEVLNGFGVSTAENFFQEAIMEPLQEKTAEIVGGKDKANWDNILNRSLEAGIDGVLSAILLNGASVGIVSAGNIVNKKNPTQTEIQTALSDTINSGKVDINSIINGAKEALKDNKYFINTESFFIQEVTPSGEISNIKETNGTRIDLLNDKLNVSPAVVKDNNSFIVIDAETGIKLDTSSYVSQTDAIRGFNDKIRNLDSATVNGINNQIRQAKLSLINQIQDNTTGTEIQNERSSLSNYRLQSPSKTKTTSFVNNSVTYNDQNINKITTTNNSNYMQNKEKEYTKQQYNDIMKTINQISDKSVYNHGATINTLRTVSNNIKNINLIKQDGNYYINSLDDDGSISYQQKIKNSPYTGKMIKNIANNAIQNADISFANDNTNTNMPQTSSEQNIDNLQSQETNYTPQSLKRIIEPFGVQQEYTKNEMAQIWNNEIVKNNYDASFDSNGNIKSYIAIEEDGGNLVVNQYDSEDNIVRSELIPQNKGKYTAKAIKNTIEKVSSLYDENRPIKRQQNIESNEVMSMKKEANEDITKSIKNFEKAKNTIDRKDVLNIANSLNIKLKTGAITMTNTEMSKKAGKNRNPQIVNITKTFEGLTSKNIKEYRKDAEDMALKLFRDVSVKIEDTKTMAEINKSGIDKTFSGAVTKSKIQTADNLKSIIQQGIYGYTTYDKNDKNQILYHNFFTPVNYENNNGLIRVVIKEFSKDPSMIDRFYYHQLEFISNKKIKGLDTLPQNLETRNFKSSPNINNSIPQKTKTVKSDKNTAINKFTQKSENNNNSTFIKGQQDIEGNEVRNMKNVTKADERIREIVKYNQDGREIKDQNYIDFIVKRYKDNKNISNIDIDTKMVENLLKEKSSKNDKLRKLYDKINNSDNISLKVKLKNTENQQLENVNLNVDITLSGIRESFSKSNNNEKYAIVPYLDKLIKTTEDGNGYFKMIDEKQRNNVKGFFYLFNTAKINNKLYAVKMDIKRTTTGDRFYVHRVSLINNEEASIQANDFSKSYGQVGQEAPSIDNSIPQNTETVKSDKNTAINKFTQKSENNNNSTFIKGQQDIEGNEVRNMKKNIVANNEFNHLSKFSSKRKNSITKLNNAVVATTSKQLKKYVLEAFNDINSKKDIYIGIMPQETIENIKNNLTQIKKENIKNIFKDNIEYAVKINQDEIRHINKKQSITVEDVINFVNSLDEVLTQFDLVSYGNYNKQNALRFEKVLDDGNHIAFTVISNQKQTIRIQSLFWDRADYKNKKRSIQLTPDDINSPSKTSKTDSLSTSIINNSIPQKTETVKSDKNTAINKYTQEAKNNTNLSDKNIEQKEIEKELHNRIQNAILNKNSRKNTYLGNVSQKISSTVKRLLGIDITGRRHILSDNDIRHMIKQHGNAEIEKTKGQIAITIKDIEKIPDIINNYDRVAKGTDNKNHLNGKEFQTIRYIKRYSDNISYVVEVIPDTGNNLTIKTMWKKTARVTNNSKTPSSTSKTKSGLDSSTLKKNPIGVNHDNTNIVLQNTSETKSNSGSNTSITQNKGKSKNEEIRFAKSKEEEIKYNNYTQKEIENLNSPKIKIANNENDVLNFIDNAKKMPSNLKLYFGKITNKIANKIGDTLGINVSNYNISLKADAVRHILNNHENANKEILRGQLPITEQDLINIPKIINKPDIIRDSGLNVKGKPSVTFEKNIAGNNIVVTYISDRHHNLEIQTMYKFKNNKKRDSATGSNVINTLNRTSETVSGTKSLNTSITQNKEKSKNEEIRFAKRSAKNQNDNIYQNKRNAERSGNYIEQEIQKIEKEGTWDNSIPVTKITDIRKTIEDYLGLGIKKGHFRQQAYAIYKDNRDVIRTKEYKDMDSILHETGHALDLGNRLKVDKEAIANELLTAIDRLGGYEQETRTIRLEEGFAEVIREYSIVPDRAKAEYSQTVSVLEGLRQSNKDFNDFITKVQQQTYNYIHQNPRNRVLSNMSIGESTDKAPFSKNWLKQEIMRNVWDKDYAVKSLVSELQEKNGKSVNELKASDNAYYLTRLAGGITDKVVSMLADGYIDENGNKLMPGLNQIGEILGNERQRFEDLDAYLLARRDTDYKSKDLTTGIRNTDSMAVIEQFKNDSQIQEASKLIYDTLDGVLQYVVNNNLISQETADNLKQSNAFYVPMQRVLENRGNQVGIRGAVSDVIKKRTGSELDVKDILENVVSNSSNMIQQVENNNILKALYNQGEAVGLTGNIYDVIDTPMTKVGTARLDTWKAELQRQGVDITNLDLEKSLDLFAPNNKVDRQNLITSFIDDNGNRVYLQFYDEIIFNSLMNMDKKFMSQVLKINSKMNMPLRYGATMANIGFAIPNMISDTAQAAIYSTAGFIPIVDNALGVLDVLATTNKTVNNFVNKVTPMYADRINTLYTIYSQTGATNSTRLSQFRDSTQRVMKDVYGTKNSETLGIKEKYKPLKRLLDFLTYIPEISEQSTRFEVFKKNYNYYKNKGNNEMDARIMAALESRDATQDFGRTGNITREINQLIPFSAARVGSIYTFAEKVKANPKQVGMRIAILTAFALAIKSLGYDDKEIEELNQRKKDDNFVFKIGDNIITIKKPQGILRSTINLAEYIQDLATGHIEDGKEGERLNNWLHNAIWDNMPADSIESFFSSMSGGSLLENAINKDLYYNTEIVKSYDLELPNSEQYYDYNSQLAIILGRVFNYSPAKIDNLISGYFGGLGTQVTNAMDSILGKTGIIAEKPEMGAESNAVGKRFIVNVNSNSASIDEIYNKKTELTKKKNGGTITDTESDELDTITSAISNLSKLNKQIKEIKKDLSLSGKEKAEQIKLLQQQKTDTARQALGKDVIYSENERNIQSTQFYPSSSTLKEKGYSLELSSEQKKEYEQLANEYYNKNKSLYNKEKLDDLKSKAKDYAKSQLMQKYKSGLVKTKK